MKPRPKEMDWIGKVACPTCNAEEGKSCVTLGDVPRDTPVAHSARRKLARERGLDPWTQRAEQVKQWNAAEVHAAAATYFDDAVDPKEVHALADKLLFAYKIAGDRVFLFVAEFLIKAGFTLP